MTGVSTAKTVDHAICSGHRTVVRVKTMTRDLFGTGQPREADMANAPCVRMALRSPTRRAKARVRGAGGSSRSATVICLSWSSPAPSMTRPSTSTR